MCVLQHPYLGNDDFQLNLEVAISMIFKISVLTCDYKHLPIKGDLVQKLLKWVFKLVDLMIVKTFVMAHFEDLSKL